MVTRIGIVGDPHGVIPNVRFTDVDFMMCPGDFCSDELKQYMFQAMRINLENRDKGITKKVFWWDLLGKHEARSKILESVAKGRAVLEHLNSFGVPVYVLPGNWDFIPDKEKAKHWRFWETDFYYKNIRGLDNIIDCDMKVRDAGNYVIVGYGKVSSPEYPQDQDLIAKETSKELAKSKSHYLRTRRRVNSLFDKAKKIGKPVIFFHHNVPYGTNIDKIVNPNSPMNGRHFGSVVAREMIDKHQPVLSEAGHMHEHYDKVEIGKTICVDSGFGPNANVLVTLQRYKVKDVEFNRKGYSSQH